MEMEGYVTADLGVAFVFGLYSRFAEFIRIYQALKSGEIWGNLQRRGVEECRLKSSETGRTLRYGLLRDNAVGINNPAI